MSKKEAQFPYWTHKEGTYDRLDHESSNFTPEEEAEFKKALFLSKGKTNNQLASLLIQQGMSAEDIIKYANDVRIDGESWNDEIVHHRGGKRSKVDKEQRMFRQQMNRIPNLFETVRGKDEVVRNIIMEKFKLKFGKNELMRVFGRDDYLPTSLFDKETWSNIKCIPGYYGRTAYIAYDSSFSALLDFATKLKENDWVGKFPTKWLEQVCDDARGSDKYEGLNYDEFFKYDMDSLLATGIDIENKVQSSVAINRITQVLYRDLGPYATIDNKAKAVTLVEEFYHAMKEMGITLVIYKDLPRWGSDYTRIKSVMRQTVKAYGNYVRLVEKQGFLMSVARKTIVEELNAYIEEHYNCRGKKTDYRFEERTDIVDAPVIEPKKKVSKQTATKIVKHYDSLEDLLKELKSGKEKTNE